MSKTKKLWKDTLLYGIAHFSTSLLAFVMLPIYTAYFSPSAFGTWDLYITTISLLMPLISFELSSATYRFLIQANEQAEQQTIISTGFFSLLRHIVISTLIAIILFSLIDFPLKWQALLLLISMLLFSFMQQCIRGLGLNRIFAGMSILHALIMVGCNLAFIFLLQLGIVAFFYAQIIASIVVILFVWMKSNFSQYIAIRTRSNSMLRAYYTYAWPIIPATASWWIMTMSDRWFIGGFLGLHANGIYAIALKVPAILLMMNTVFSLAWKDNAIIHYEEADKDTYFTMIFTVYFRFLTTTVIGLILLAKPLILTFIDPAYAAAWKYSGILLVATLFHAFALFWSAGFHGAKQTKAIFHSSVIGALVNVIGNLLLIPFFGLYGIASATMVAFLVTWILRVRAAKVLFRIRFPSRDMVVLLGGVGAALVVSVVGSDLLMVGAMIVSAGGFGVYNRGLLGGVWRRIRR